MRSFVAVIVLIGQLQWLPGGVACNQRHAAKDPCEQTMPEGPAVGALSHAADGSVGCASLGPCAAVTPAVLPSVIHQFVAEVVPVGAQGAPARFIGFVAPPLSPPPQA